MVFVAFPISQRPILEELQASYLESDDLLVVDFTVLRPILQAPRPHPLVTALTPHLNLENLIFTEAWEALRRVP